MEFLVTMKWTGDGEGEMGSRGKRGRRVWKRKGRERRRHALVGDFTGKLARLIRKDHF